MRTASSCGPGSARTHACWPGSSAAATTRPIGYVPEPEHLQLGGLNRRRVADALSVDLDEARSELDQTQEHLAQFGDKLPKEIRTQFEALKERLS